jgi:PTH1 family peptidyl-tRNA hydrolase
VDLIAGLGNPGPKYKDTRHNIGFQIISSLSRELGVRLKSRRFQSINTFIELENNNFILLRPRTFMNLSGKSIKACADFYDIKTKDILIIHDDLDLSVGKTKVVRQGGAGGHKGVTSVIDHLGSTLFPRIKIGIGRPRYGENIEDYVLEPFYDDQKEPMEKAIRLAVHACRLFVDNGLEYTMNQIN